MAEFDLEKADKHDEKRAELRGKVLSLKDLVELPGWDGCEPYDREPEGGEHHPLLFR